MSDSISSISPVSSSSNNYDSYSYSSYQDNWMNQPEYQKGISKEESSFTSQLQESQENFKESQEYLYRDQGLPSPQA